MVYIEDVLARQILDSRGNPTLEVEVKLSEKCWHSSGSLRCFYGKI